MVVGSKLRRVKPPREGKGRPEAGVETCFVVKFLFAPTKPVAMLLETTEAYNFRNLSGRVEWGAGLNIICGPNGQGKTNWLEAIYLLATTKSFKTQHWAEAIRFGEQEAAARGRVSRAEGLQRELSVTLQGATKTIAVNGKREPIAGYLAQLHAVSFTADDLEIVRGTPEARRKFLDRGAVSLHPAYVKTLSDYNRVLKQKNRLLRDALDNGFTADKTAEMLAPWNAQLARCGAQIHAARMDYTARLNEVLEKRLFEKEEVSIRYVSSFEGKGDLSAYQELFEERLRFRLPNERAAGHALIGPHRDELEIRFDGRDLRSFGSSGQQRSALILLDLAAISVYYSQHGEYPLFLIDDVDAELDYNRIGRLLEHLAGRAQTFITTSKESLVEKFAAGARIYEITAGEAREITA
jgi:DNA replication and repair protein RecF